MGHSKFADGVVISATSFVGDQPFDVEVASAFPIADGATAKIFLGRVDEATQAKLGITHTVALKLFVNNMADYQQQLLRRELRAIRQVRHPYILPYTGTAVFDFNDIIISPYMRNGNLMEYICKNNADHEHLLLQVATAVDFLHTKHKMIHGDLKCENVLVSDDGSALLADFGLSTFIEQTEIGTRSATSLRQLMTLRFAAPELLFGTETKDDLDTKRPARRTAKTDVYAFGMMVVQAFTRQLPWAGCTIEQILVKLYMRITHPRAQGSITSVDIPDSWWNVCLDCWCYTPSLRPCMKDVLDVLTVDSPVKIQEVHTVWGHSTTRGRTMVDSHSVPGTNSDHDRLERAINTSRRQRAMSTASRSSRKISVSARKRPTSPVPPVPPLPAAIASPRPPARETSRVRAAGKYDYVIAVVGAAGCGKTTVIHKGLGSWGLLDEPLCLTIGPSGLGICISSRSTPDSPSQKPSTTIQILEVETSLFDYSQLGVWPVGMPVVDGIVVCYDASDPRSFDSIPELIRGYAGLGVVVVLLACKSEQSPKMVMPQRAVEVIAPYSIGLIEVSSKTDVGKHKMRDCFSWVMKAISRNRRERRSIGHHGSVNDFQEARENGATH